MRKKKEIGLEEMTLKDFIAIFAMQSILRSGGVINETFFKEEAELSYKMADAMMEARNGN
jgi:hypothetical protein